MAAIFYRCCNISGKTMHILSGGDTILLFRHKLPSAVHRAAFKASMLVFLFSSIGDIAFGDRAELLKHGTYMILTLITYEIYLNRMLEHREVVGPNYFQEADRDWDGIISDDEYETFLRNKIAPQDQEPLKDTKGKIPP